MRLLYFCILNLAMLCRAAAADDLPIYADTLQNGWENWSWAKTVAASTPVHAGTKSFMVTAGAWEAAYFHSGSVDASLYTNLTFWINGGPGGGQKFLIQGVSNGAAKTSVDLPVLSPNSWQQMTVSLQQLGVANDPGFDGFWIQDRTGTTQPVFYLDDISLIAGAAVPPAPPGVIAIQIDAAAHRRPISDLIYGVAFASAADLELLNSPLNRSGGNAESRYNWQLNAHNRAFDWYFESLPDASATPGAASDDFVAETKKAGAQAMLTIPMIGWVAKLGPNRGRLASFSIAKYGAQTDRDAQWFPDAGNGISSVNNQPIAANDPADANTQVTSAFQQDWIRHLLGKWGNSGSGGVRWYMMDNEPSLWHSTHRDVFKTGLTMAELRDRFLDYAAKLKEVDPGAMIAGPEEWGWSGYFFSGYDQQWGGKNGWSNLPDRAAHSGAEYLPWLLDQLRQHDQQTGRRLLDLFTVHFYPQGGEFDQASNVSTAMQQRRNRSTRSLWDPNYTDESWINDTVRLIPRLREWVTQHYPGTQIGLTEYNWGAENHINGATTQADLLGIFGREGLDVANRWTTPAAASPTFKAFQMFRNYDGRHSTFGNTSILATAPNPDTLSSFAATRSSDGALTLMVINKVTTSNTVAISLANFASAGVANVWQLTSANEITRRADALFSGTTLTNSVPGQSITLFVFPGAAQVRFTAVAVLASGKLSLQLSGPPGETYQIEKTSDLRSWTTVQSVTLTGGNASVAVTASAQQEFFRATK